MFYSRDISKHLHIEIYTILLQTPFTLFSVTMLLGHYIDFLKLRVYILLSVKFISG